MCKESSLHNLTDMRWKALASFGLCVDRVSVAYQWHGVKLSLIWMQISKVCVRVISQVNLNSSWEILDLVLVSSDGDDVEEYGSTGHCPQGMFFCYTSYSHINLAGLRYQCCPAHHRFVFS
jgi:hypothetical protein